MTTRSGTYLAVASPNFSRLSRRGFVIGGAINDVLPPVETPISPANNAQPGTTGAFPADYNTAKTVPIVVNAIDAVSAIGYVTIFAKFSDRVHTETVYAGNGSQSGWLTPYKSFSTVSGSGAATIGFTFSIARDDGWPKGQVNGSPITVDVTLQATDAKGNVLL